MLPCDPPRGVVFLRPLTSFDHYSRGNLGIYSAREPLGEKPKATGAQGSLSIACLGSAKETAAQRLTGPPAIAPAGPGLPSDDMNDQALGPASKEKRQPVQAWKAHTLD